MRHAVSVRGSRISNEFSTGFFRQGEIMKRHFVSTAVASFLVTGLVAGSAMAADAIDEIPAAPAAECR